MPDAWGWDRVRFKTGDKVTANEDPRHVARVDAIFNQRVLRVTWIGTGWRSDLLIVEDQVEHAEDYR